MLYAAFRMFFQVGTLSAAGCYQRKGKADSRRLLDGQFESIPASSLRFLLEPMVNIRILIATKITKNVPTAWRADTRI